MSSDASFAMNLDIRVTNALIVRPVLLSSRTHQVTTAHRTPYHMNHSEVLVRHHLTPIDILLNTQGTMICHPITIATTSVTHDVVSHNFDLRDLIMSLPTMIPIRGM